MRKENFKYLYSFKYNNKDYIYLYSKNYPFYFLEYNHTKKGFNYPDISIFKELYNKFYSNDAILSFNIKNDIKKIKETLANLSITITPLIRTTSGLISIVITLSMCGCNQIDNTKASNNESVAIVETQNTNQDISNYFKSYNIDIINKQYNSENYIFVKGFINNDNKKQITIQDFDGFKKYKHIDFIPNWNDVIEAFQINKNIDKEKKDIILDCINNMANSKELKNLDLSVLYTNAQRMKFIYLSSEEMINNVNRESVYSYFDTLTGTVYLPNDKPLEKFEFIHEVLGHGTLAYREETKDSVIVFDCTNQLMLPTDNKYTGESIGIMISEGGANMIAHLATNDYSVDSFYTLYEEELRVIAQLCNINLGELFNHKGIALYDLMYKNNINTPVEYIFKMDGIYKGKLYCEFSDLMERLFVDATEEKFINSSVDNQDKIIKSTIKIIKDSYFKDKKELNFDYTGGSIRYNFEESADKYKENINHLRSK